MAELDPITKEALASRPKNVRVTNLQSIGFGPNGKLNREDWRRTCLSKLIQGKSAWNEWQAALGSSGWHVVVQTTDFSCEIEWPDGHIEQGHITSSGSCDADFVGVIFPEELDLTGYQFHTTALFSWATLHKDCYFSSVKFHDSGLFEGMQAHARFFAFVEARYNVHFERSLFWGPLFFNGCEVSGGVHFHKAYLLGGLIATSSKFKNALTFDKVRCLGASFDNVSVTNSANFEDSSFMGSTSFRNSSFNGPLWCRNTKFDGDVSFQAAKFLEDSRFDEALFFGQANFENAQFDRIGHFDNATFRFSPSFLGVAQETVLIFQPKNFELDVSADAVNRFAGLKQLSEAAGQVNQSLHFNALELKARRHQPEEDVGFVVVTWLYEKLSDYGRSLLRPLWCYVILLLATFVLSCTYTMIAATRISSPSEFSLPASLFDLGKECPNQLRCVDDGKVHMSGYRAAFEYSLFRAAGILDFANNDKQTSGIYQRLFRNDYEPVVMRIWGIFKGISSIALLFLLALGLRNRYRLK